MVVQKTIDNLKGRPNDEKKAVASGVAIGFVIILLIAWGFFFIKKVQNGGIQNLGGGAQDQFNFTTVKEAQLKLQQTYASTSDELRQIRDSAASNSFQNQGAQPVDQGGQSNQFEVPPDTSNY